MLKKIIIVALSALMCSCSYRETLVCNNAKIKYVLIKEKSKGDFVRFSDIFTKSKYNDHLCVLPKDCDKGGLYFVIGLDAKVKNLPPGAWIEIRCLFASEDKNEEVYSSDINREFDERLNEIYFKISDDCSIRNNLTAWKIVIYSETGEPLVVKKSYLWVDKS